MIFINQTKQETHISYDENVIDDLMVLFSSMALSMRDKVNRQQFVSELQSFIGLLTDDEFFNEMVSHIKEIQ